jgi:hypothetical protein
MLKVKSNGSIIMSRGDTVSLDVYITDSEGQEYILKEDESLYFSAKQKLTDKNYAIPPKKLDGKTLHLMGEDTYDLDFGTYLYDIQLRKSDGRCNTIIKPTELVIEGAITAYGDR